ncbi:purine nucleoside permease [Paracoccus sediminis]|uniref:Purine nucleoside permease n=1 Tax=Paracoccus sediminis TaxID=1214787 RepID=A0A238YAR6_9RHOB|nr:purine nucleoside permease [Paracoccus sediminis]TBN46981.1 purine nucleoside permease [Paracoccus sediminis]SNR67851.1 Purine nucleoside permease [Paracoccus sediminis]
MHVLINSLAASALTLASAGAAWSEPIQVKVFVGSMFEIGENTGDRAGEYQHWYERYWQDAKANDVPGAFAPVHCNDDGVCGSVLGMGKVNASASMQAILLNPDYDFSQAYYLITGVAGTPPSRGTIGDVVWGSWLIDYDLGHRWAPEEGETGAPVFIPREGYEDYRVHELNPELVAWGIHLSSDVDLKDSEEAQTYRTRYPEEAAQAAPSVKVGTHMTGDTFFHGPGLSAEAQYMAELYGADDYLVTEMEDNAIAQVIKRLHGTDRIAAIRGSVNFDQGNPSETTLQHLDPAPGETAGGFAETVENIALVGAPLVDHIVSEWETWKNGVPAAPEN